MNFRVYIFLLSVRNLQQIYFGEILLHDQCYESAKMAPVATVLRKPQKKACGAPSPSIMVRPDGDVLLNPLCEQGILLHGKLDTTLIDAVIGLCQIVQVC